jgi:hypothetical protein
MSKIPKRTVRKLVTLPVELAEEVDRFREVTGASSESDALKVLIGWGLTRSDKPEDLYERCRRATGRGLSLGDVITSVIADHPLVESAILGALTLDVYLKTQDVDHENQLRFRFRRNDKTWVVDRTQDHGRSWQEVIFANPQEMAAARNAKASGGRPATRSKAELDDDIPF